jgi:hypothetical protein
MIWIIYAQTFLAVGLLAGIAETLWSIGGLPGGV